MNNIVPLIIVVHATKVTEEISDEFVFSEYTIVDGDLIDIKYPVE